MGLNVFLFVFQIENPRYLREKSVPLSPIFKSSFERNNTFANDHGIQSREAQIHVTIVDTQVNAHSSQ
ncbi:hypothetical protein ILYODFUR_037891 [Ilyodon furcidens]|uniref:Uncharacterized protein n=1 Tax=Ilyodon furcidens TaxID=33524 RepID=A0ABV0SSI3_9TELE